MTVNHSPLPSSPSTPAPIKKGGCTNKGCLKWLLWLCVASLFLAGVESCWNKITGGGDRTENQSNTQNNQVTPTPEPQKPPAETIPTEADIHPLAVDMAYGKSKAEWRGAKRSKIGEPFQVGQVTWKVTGVEKSTDLGDLTAQGVFLVLRVSALSQTTEKLVPDYYGFFLMDVLGNKFAAKSEAGKMIATDKEGNKMFYQPLQKGREVHGRVVFDVPVDAESLVLRITNIYAKDKFNPGPDGYVGLPPIQ